MTFTRENTIGYTANQLESLNIEWAAIVQDDELEPETDEYYQREKQFSDEVSNRCWDDECQGCYKTPCECLPDDACCDPE